ncbi:MAG: insulinase family protein [Candidatus Rokuibacteriota bacterium]
MTGALKRVFLGLGKGLGFFRIARRLTRARLRILCYHSFATGEESAFRPKLFISAGTFRRRLAWLAANGYPVLPLDEAVDGLGRGTLPPRATVITIDDGWVGVHAHGWPLLREFGFPATLYVTTHYVEHDTPVFDIAIQYMLWKTTREQADLSGLGLPVAYDRPISLRADGARDEAARAIIALGEAAGEESDRSHLAKSVGERLGVDHDGVGRQRVYSLMRPRELAEVSAAGLDLQLHSHAHEFPEEERAVAHELAANRAVLEPVVGRRLSHFCYPSGRWSRAHWPWLERDGIRSATTCDPGLNDPATPRLALRRFLDGENIDQLDFEAEMSGFKDLLRDLKARVKPAARLLVAGLLGGLAWAGPAAGQTPAPAATRQLAVTEATLENGLRVLVQDDPRNPIVAVQVFYRVGSRNERPGATGLAHFLEHMMFKGTPTYGRGQIARLIEENGGRDNAYTTKDVTSYYTNIAADKLDLVLRIEADRMRHLLLDAAEIDSERKVVTEERRMRSEDDPDGLVYEAMSSLAFKAHPYRWPIIGWMSDIARINRAELRAFYDTYYLPNNAILVIAGDVRAPAALAMVRRHFAGLRRGPPPPPVTAVEPPAIDERRLVVRREQAQLPVVNIAWHVPNHTSPDAPALELLSTVLSSGRTSRLYQKLVYEQRMVLGAGGDYSYFSLDPSLFWFYAAPLPGQAPEAVEQALLAEIERLKQEVVPEEELARARNQIEASFVWQQDSVFSRASVLGRFEMLGSWRLLDDYLPKLRAVTAADLQRVARTYFPLDRKNVSILLPAEPAAPASR